MADTPTKGPEYRKMMKRRIRALVNERIGTPDVAENDGSKLLQYGRDGAFDYELYREVQELGNKQKLTFQWVPRAHIEIIAADIAANITAPKFGICHGSRRGNEQAWFKEILGMENVIGTEISETASDFPDTIQWDFHEVKPEWIGATDFIYSNSWDHTYDPSILFPAWVSCLAPGGRMYLDHSRDQSGDTVNVLDPFGVKLDKLVRLLDELCGKSGQVAGTLKGAVHKRADQIDVVVFERSA